MKPCRDVSNNDTYNEIYQKVPDMVSPKEISTSRIVKHQTMRINVPAESPKNYYYICNIYYPFSDNVILLLDQRFSGHAQAVMRLISLLPVNAAILLSIFVKLNQQSFCFFPYYSCH